MTPDVLSKVTVTINSSTSNISEMVQDIAILTIVHWWEVVSDLSNGAIFNDLKSPLTQTSKARHYRTLTISEAIQDGHIFSTDH